MTKIEYVRAVKRRIRERGPQFSDELGEFKRMLSEYPNEYRKPGHLLTKVDELLHVGRPGVNLYYFEDQEEEAMRRAKERGILQNYQPVEIGAPRKLTFRLETEKQLYRKLIRRYLDLIILSLINSNPFETNHYYGIRMRIFEKFGILYGPGTVIPKIKKLTNVGHLEREYFLYRITEKGREALKAGIGELKEVLNFLIPTSD